MKDIRNALQTFRWAASNISAYRKFLKKNGVAPEHIRTEDDFKRVPIMDKVNYLRAYAYRDLFPENVVPPFLSMSSGSSGKPFYWPRDFFQEKQGGQIHERVFRDVFGITKTDRTLVIVGFSMGTWIAGMFTVNSCRALIEKGYRLTIASPGIEKEDILSILKDFAPNFDTVILTGYPPFLMDVIVEARERKINLRAFDLKLLFAGENFSERWRDMIHEFAHIPKAIGGSVSIYGSADADILGHETTLSIYIRRKAHTHQKLAEALWGTTSFLPTLVQYHPDKKFFESADGELIFTARAGIPLIRYNIHDRGIIIPYNKVKKILKDFHLLKEAEQHGLREWNLPFLTLAGRNDVAVTFYGLNIYPENIKAGLEDPLVARYVTGKFITFTRSVNREKNQKLVIECEMRRNVRSSQKIRSLVQKSMIKNFLKLNIEYRKLTASIGNRTRPEIKLIEGGSAIFEVRKAKHRWIKKP